MGQVEPEEDKNGPPRGCGQEAHTRKVWPKQNAKIGTKSEKEHRRGKMLLRGNITIIAFYSQ
jgi:hypothetical protein